MSAMFRSVSKDLSVVLIKLQESITMLDMAADCADRHIKEFEYAPE